MQWKFPRYQSTSVFPTTSNTRRIVDAFFRIAEPQRRAAMHLGHTWYVDIILLVEFGVLLRHELLGVRVDQFFRDPR